LNFYAAQSIFYPLWRESPRYNKKCAEYQHRINVMMIGYKVNITGSMLNRVYQSIELIEVQKN